MLNQKLIKNLTEYGLSDTEARVYCAALALDGGPVDKISKRADTNRSSSYAVLERLKEMGLVSQVKKGNKTVFKASQPERLYDLLNERKEVVQKILPDLKSLFDISRGKPDVRFYEGREGLKTVLNSILDEAKEILIFGEADSFIKAIPGWTEAYVEKRAGKNIKVKLILKASPYAVSSIKRIQAAKTKTSELIKVRMLPEAYRINASGFDIYNNKVVLYSFEKQNNAVVIENNLISDMMRTVFGILWDTAEKYEHLLR